MPSSAHQTPPRTLAAPGAAAGAQGMSTPPPQGAGAAVDELVTSLDRLALEAGTQAQGLTQDRVASKCL